MKLTVQIIGQLEGNLLKRALRDGKHTKPRYDAPPGKLCKQCKHSKHCGESEEELTCEMYKPDHRKIKGKRR